MKQTSKIMAMMLLMVAAIAAPAAAQEQQQQAAGRKGPQQRPEQRFNPEDFAKAQASRIAEELAFDDKTTEKFIETYARCQKEQQALCPQGQCKQQQGAPKAEAKTEAAIKEQIEGQFEREQKALDLRVKYYKEYSKFLTQKQIARVYQLDKPSKPGRGGQPRDCEPNKPQQPGQCGQPGQPGQPGQTGK